MSQITAASSNTAQIEYWNSSAGETWAQFQESLDRQIEPLGLAAIDVLKPREGQHIIDIGCGCGQTTLSLASRVGVTGSVMGVDISKPMLEVALRRPRPAPNLPVTFRQLDAQTDDLGHYLFDAAFSRFGVMFFSEPATAFANIRTSLKLVAGLSSSVGELSARTHGWRCRSKRHCRSYNPLNRPIRQHPDRLHLPTRVACAPC